MKFLEQLDIERVINASGRMTKLGVNTLSKSVLDAMSVAGVDYWDIDELQSATGREIARLIHAEDAMVTSGAAAGISLMVAACIAGGELTRIQALPDAGDAPNDILIQAGHQIDFGATVTQLIRIAGGNPVAVGSTNSVLDTQLIESIGPRTAAFLFVQSHHTVQKGMLSLERCIAICVEHKVPIIVDAAAEEDLTRFTESGIDLVTFSGGKAIGGPTSGIVAGRTGLVEACRAQSKGIGRPMKVGKEGLLGLYAAVSEYVESDRDAEHRRCSDVVTQMISELKNHCSLQRLTDEAGRGIERVGIVDSPQRAADLVEFLENGTPPIYPRTHLLNIGVVALDPRPLKDQDIEIVTRRVQEFYS